MPGILSAFAASLAALVLLAAVSRPGSRWATAAYYALAIGVALTGLAAAAAAVDGARAPMLVRDQWLVMATAFAFLGAAFAMLGVVEYGRSVASACSALVHGAIASCIGCMVALMAPAGDIAGPAATLVFLLWWWAGPYRPALKGVSWPLKALGIMTVALGSSIAFA